MELKKYLTDPILVDKDENLSTAMERMEKNDIEDIPVTNKGRYIGKLSYDDLANELGSVRKDNKPASRLHVSTAYQKDGGLLNTNMNVKTAASELVSRESTILLVQDDSKNIIGSLRSKDAIKKINIEKKATEIINKDFEVISPTDRVINARRRILKRGKKVLVIKEKKSILGIVTSKEIAKGMNSFRRLVPDEKQDSRIKNLLVEDIMENNYLETNPSTEVSSVSRKLESEREFLTLITQKNEVLGFINQIDLLKTWCGDER